MQYKKHLISTLLFSCFMLTSINAQNLQLTFTGSGLSTTIDSVQVLNLTQGTSVTVKSAESLQLVGSTTDIETHLPGKGNLRIFPNPMTETSGIEFFNFKGSLVNIEVFDVAGKIVLSNKQNLIQGNHQFEISGLSPGIYMVNVLTLDGRYAGKLLSDGANSVTPAIKYMGYTNASVRKSVLKSTQNSVQMPYNDGERLLLKGSSGNYSRVLTLVATQNQTINFEFIACTDAAGKHYPVVTIGTQTWMAENLLYLPSVSPSSKGSQTTSYFYVEGYQGTNVSEAKASANYSTYGVLYNWEAAKAACPAGWHLPSDAEWTQLADYPGGASVAGGKLKETGITHWKSPNTGATNETGFTALPGGSRSHDWAFYGVGNYGLWWSATENNTYTTWYRGMDYHLNSVSRSYGFKELGFSVRCVKN